MASKTPKLEKSVLHQYLYSVSLLNLLEREAKGFRNDYIR